MAGNLRSRDFVISLLLVMVALPSLGAADDKEEHEGDQGKRFVSHQALTVPLDLFCKEAGIPVKTAGEGPCRVMTIGQGTFPQARAVLESAEKTLQMLDRWTGRQQAFVSENPDPREVYHLVFFTSEEDYAGFIDFLREKKILRPSQNREDLVKKLRSLPGPRTIVTVTARAAFPGRFAAHVMTMLAVNTFFQSRGDVAPPAWLPSGLSAELQRQFGTSGSSIVP